MLEDISNTTETAESGKSTVARQKLALVAVIVFCAGALLTGSLQRMFSNPVPENPIKIVDPPAGNTSQAAANTNDILPASATTAASSSTVVHVAGRVKKPGVYTLPPGARVNDAVKLAGGALADADLDAVNLAAKANDGEQIFVPKKGSEAAYSLPESISSSRPSLVGASAVKQLPFASSKSSTRPSGKININTAGMDELDKLPGVGPATAHKIISYRKAVGGFARPEELINVPGIGAKKYAEMRPYVTVR